MITGWGIIAFRDPHGIRPLSMGSRVVNGFTERLFSSESVACNTLGFNHEGDVSPGEAVIARMDGTMSSKQCSNEVSHSPCIFEHVYFARPDSVIDGISVHSSRIRMGASLARRISEKLPDHGIDSVIAVPDSGRIAALELARVLDVPYREGFVKNRYIGRTFIMPGQSVRKDSVRKKLNTIREEFQDKVVLIVDDSIVRGNTSRRDSLNGQGSWSKKGVFRFLLPLRSFTQMCTVSICLQSQSTSHMEGPLSKSLRLLEQTG